jgi:phage baseplate assembly protein W
VCPSLDVGFALLGWPGIVAEAVYKRWTTARGQMPFNPDYGEDIRGYLNQSVTAQTLQTARANLQREAQADERVLSADVELAFDAAESRLRVTCAIVTAEGPFKMTMSISKIGIDTFTHEAT